MNSLIRSVSPKKLFKRAKQYIRNMDLELPHEERVRKWGHRKYIGGGSSEAWYGIGKRQYHFLVSNGLKSHHKFLDVACGSLRLGQYLIPMLEDSNYFGLEAEEQLVKDGISKEMMFDVVDLKNPNFSFNYDFDLSFCDGYDFAIAQSLFTHLTSSDIDNCFSAMSSAAKPGSKFYFTFFEGDESKNKFDVSHANREWKYQYQTLKSLAEGNGFNCEYIGDWGHERNQMMAVAVKPL